MVGRFIQQQNIRMGKKKTDQGNLRLLAARELRQPFPFIFFGKSETSEEPVIFLFPGETFPIPFVRTWTGFKKFFLHGNGGVRKSLLTEQAGGQGSRSKDSLCLGMIITVKGKFSRQKSKECCLSTAISAHDGNLLVSTDLKIKMCKDSLCSNAERTVLNL